MLQTMMRTTLARTSTGESEATKQQQRESLLAKLLIMPFSQTDFSSFDSRFQYSRTGCCTSLSDKIPFFRTELNKCKRTGNFVRIAQEQQQRKRVATAHQERTRKKEGDSSSGRRLAGVGQKNC